MDRCADAIDIEDDSRRSRELRNQAREVRQAAQDKAAVRLLNAQAKLYLPLSGERFPYQTLEVIAETAVTMYGGADAVELRKKEWRARWLDRKAAEQPIDTTAEEQITESSKKPDAVKAERTALWDTYRAKARAQGIKVTDEMLAKAAKPGKWNDRTQVTWWKRNDAKCKPPHDRLIRAVLAKDPRSIWQPKGPK